jgi:hypothetical protein
MSSGGGCKCPERKKKIKERRWAVRDRKCNYSAFNGYHQTPSEYSAVECLACGAIWRTNADYVADLPDLKEEPRKQEKPGGSFFPPGKCPECQGRFYHNPSCSQFKTSQAVK